MGRIRPTAPQRVNENIPADTAEKMATKRGVEALATGIVVVFLFVSENILDVY